jgi:hypothetical protein
MNGYAVRLQWDEADAAARVGTLRRLECLKSGKYRKTFDPEGGWKTDIEGAGAEMAYAKLRNCFWSHSVNRFKDPDFNHNVEIRHTTRWNGSLIVREPVSEDSYYVLVTGELPNYRIVGWIQGRAAMKPEWYQAKARRPPAYFVPQSELRSFASLWRVSTLTAAG